MSNGELKSPFTPETLEQIKEYAQKRIREKLNELKKSAAARGKELKKQMKKNKPESL